MRPERFGCLRDDLLAMLAIRDIAGQKQRAASGFLDPALRFLGVVMLVEIGDGDVRAFARIGDRHRAADAAVRARDERDFAGEPVAALVARFAVIGRRVHRAGESRAIVLLLRRHRRAWVSAIGGIAHVVLLTLPLQERPWPGFP